MLFHKGIQLMAQKNPRPLISRLKPPKIGYILQNGNINFSNEKTAIEYGKNKILQQIKKDNTEYGVLIKGKTIIGEAKGTDNSVNIGEMENFIKRLWNNSNLKRDVKFFHGHPDIYAPGKTLPLSGYEGDISTAIAAKLKSIVAYNSRGEFNRIDFLSNFSSKRFKELNTKFEEQFIEKVIQKNGIKSLRSEEFAKFMHEFYKKYMPQCGLKYTTNFNNLI